MKKTIIIFAIVLLTIGLAVAGITSVSKPIPDKDFDLLASAKATTLGVSGKLSCTATECNELCVVNPDATGFQTNICFKLTPYSDICDEYNNETSECMKTTRTTKTDKQLQTEIENQIDAAKDRIVTRLAINKAKQDADKKEAVTVDPIAITYTGTGAKP